jgi:hypothetical protein
MLICWDCIPVSWKPASDFNADSGAVSMESLTFYTENITIVPVPLSDVLPRTAATGGVF